MLQLAIRAARTCMFAAIVTFWMLVLRPLPLGGPAAYLVVRGDSMLPTRETGDLVVLHSASWSTIGDVVAYRVPEGEFGEGHLILHRIVGGDGATGWVMQGDNNPAPDPWRPKDGDVVGRPWLAVPRLGLVIAWIYQPVILAGLAAAIMVGVIIGRPSKPSPKAGRLLPNLEPGG